MERYSEAHYAREEINHTNHTHIPWINVWGLVTLLLYATWLLTEKWQFLLLVPYGILPMIGLMIRAEVLVRRHWTLYLKLSGQSGATPDKISRLLVLLGNLWGLMLAVAVLVLAGNEAGSALYGWAWAGICLGNALVGVGLVLFWQAGKHKPEFD